MKEGVWESVRHLNLSLPAEIEFEESCILPETPAQPLRSSICHPKRGQVQFLQRDIHLCKHKMLWLMCHMITGSSSISPLHHVCKWDNICGWPSAVYPTNTLGTGFTREQTIKSSVLLLTNNLFSMCTQTNPD